MGFLALGVTLLGCLHCAAAGMQIEAPVPSPTPPTAPHSTSRRSDVPRPTPMAELKPRRAVERDHDLTTMFVAPDSICGYNKGSPDHYVSCKKDFSCGFVTTPGGVQGVACCSDIVNCPNEVIVGCLDLSEAVKSGYCDGDGHCSSWRIGSTRLCTHTKYPLCHTLLYQEASATGYTCGSDPQASIETMNTAPEGHTKAFQQITIGPNDHENKQPQATAPASYDGGGLEPNDSSSDREGGVAAENPKDGEGSSSDDTKDEKSEDASKSGGGNVPAIVGGVVGGVAAVGLGALAVAFFLVRRNKARKAGGGGPRSISREEISYPMQPAGSHGPALWEQERFGIRDTAHATPQTGFVMSPITKTPRSGGGVAWTGMRALGKEEGGRVSTEIAELPASPLDR